MKLYIKIIVIFLTLSYLINAQITSPTMFPVQEHLQNNYKSFLLGLANNDLIMFWYDSTAAQLKSSKSTDGGLNWQTEINITVLISDEFGADINAIELNSGRILLTYRTNQYYSMYSDDNGITWSSPVFLPTAQNPAERRRVYFSSLFKLPNGVVGFAFSKSGSNNLLDAKGLYQITGTDGIYWSGSNTIAATGKNGKQLGLNPSDFFIVYQDSTQNNYDIFLLTSTDAGSTWSVPVLLIGDNLSQTNPEIIKDANDKIWIYYTQEEETPFEGILQSDIRFIYSTDYGITWSTPESFTKYVGYDDNHKISLWDGRPIITFSSSRSYNFAGNFSQIFFTLADVTIDTSVSPFMYKFLHAPENPDNNQLYIVQALVDDDKAITSVKLIVQSTFSTTPDTLEMYDDGLHYDSLAGNKIYGTAITLNSYAGLITFNFEIEDDDNNLAQLKGGMVAMPPMYVADKYLIDENNFKLPIDNKGILANVQINGQEVGLFDGHCILFSGGFMLSGLHNGNIWSNAVASASLLEDYYPGPVGSDRLDPFNKLYIVKSSDPPFGTAWQTYAHAVNLGADFYDGDGDGIYNPVDKNNNGVWDADEDMPDLLGNITAWCVYNDGVPGAWRRWNDQQPMGIEIQQTVFASSKNNSDPINNMIFVRYRITNKGTVSNSYDSVYFAIWTDPDLGDPADDLVGSDTLLNMGYVYNDSSDYEYGSDPPALGTSFLQGPAAYIPDETFIDNNGNGLYDDGVDTPLDSAIINKGPKIGSKVLQGARNQSLSAFTHTIGGDPSLSDPNTAVEARNYLLGLNRSGGWLDPCNLNYGQVYGVPCNTVNPIFNFSGDPVARFGWMDSHPTDKRMTATSGPFNLEADKPIDIIIGYVIGRGNDALNSVSVMKAYTQNAIEIYNYNFTNLPTAIENEPVVISDYKLFQNYPNPFNPTTNIQYAVGNNAFVTLKVYDILGNEVVTLVNEYKEAGMYNVQFTMNNLPAGRQGLSSGVYFYQLKAGDPSTSSGQVFMQTKKMILLK